jgi:hypothetical protein
MSLNELDMDNTRRVLCSGFGRRWHSSGSGFSTTERGLRRFDADPNNPAVPGTIINYPNRGGTNVPYLADQPAHSRCPSHPGVCHHTPASVECLEPLEGYDTTGFQSPRGYSGTIEGYYATPRDKPLDLDRYEWSIDARMAPWFGVPFTYSVWPIRLGRIHAIESLPDRRFVASGSNLVERTVTRWDRDRQRGPITRNAIRLFVSSAEIFTACQDRTEMRRQFWPQEPFLAPEQVADWGVDRPTHRLNYFGFHLRSTLGSLNQRVLAVQWTDSGWISRFAVSQGERCAGGKRFHVFVAGLEQSAVCQRVRVDAGSCAAVVSTVAVVLAAIGRFAVRHGQSNPQYGHSGEFLPLLALQSDQPRSTRTACWNMSTSRRGLWARTCC